MSEGEEKRNEGHGAGMLRRYESRDTGMGNAHQESGRLGYQGERVYARSGMGQEVSVGIKGMVLCYLSKQTGK